MINKTSLNIFLFLLLFIINFSCERTDIENNNLKILSIENINNSEDKNNEIFGIWYVLEINKIMQTTTLRSFIWNPEIYIYDTIESGIRYEFDKQNRFYDNRLGVNGIWTVIGNIIKTEIFLPRHNGDIFIGYEKINKNILFEIIDNNYAIFQYIDLFTGEMVVEKVVRWNKELFELIKHGNLSDIEYFFDIQENKYIINNRYENDVTILMYALSQNREDIALFLIEIGVDINAKNIFGMTALHYACRSDYNGQYYDVIKKIIEKGAYVNATDNLGQTPLDYTLFDNNAFTDSMKKIQILLKDNGGFFSNSNRFYYSRQNK